MKSKLLTLVFFLSYTFLFSQTPSHTAPTLQVGLDGLAFGKGALDSELIMEIIAEKQSEIKLRVAQNILLQPLNESGATIYGFGDNILKAVIEEKDPILRKRKILESTVNTLFVTGFTEFYLQKIKKNYSNQDHAIYEIRDLIFNQDNGLNLFFSFSEDKEKLPQKEKKYNKDNRQTIFYSILLDIATEAIRENSKLKELGVLNISYSKTHEYQSNFLNLSQRKLKSLNISEEKLIDIKNHSNTIFNEMKEDINILVQLIGITKHIIKDRNFRANPTQLTYVSSTSTITGFGNIKTPLLNIIELSLEPQQYSKIYSMLNYIDKIEAADLDELNNAELSDIVYTFSIDFISTLESLGTPGIDIYSAIKALRVSSNQITDKVLKTDKLKNTFDFLMYPDNLEFFTNLLSRLYEFDKGATYIEYFNLISEISDFLEQDPNFKNPDIKEKLSYFNTFVKDYVVISEDPNGEEFIDFNVESFLGQLSEMPKNKPQRINFLFNVGMSTGFFLKNPLELTNEESLQNLSFIAEKIGVKWKIYNPGFWKPRSPGETYNIRGSNWIKTGVPKEPIINNIFLSFYGSGLLYNVFNVTTENEFNSPFLGASLGVGFFNNLDFSVSTAVPVISNQPFSNSFDYPMLSINFDIRFNEYIQRLGEKRKASQTQKALAKAQN